MLVDIRDRPEPQTTYVVEDNIIIVDDDMEVSSVLFLLVKILII